MGVALASAVALAIIGLTLWLARLSQRGKFEEWDERRRALPFEQRAIYRWRWAWAALPLVLFVLGAMSARDGQVLLGAIQVLQGLAWGALFWNNFRVARSQDRREKARPGYPPG